LEDFKYVYLYKSLIFFTKKQINKNRINFYGRKNPRNAKLKFKINFYGRTASRSVFCPWSTTDAPSRANSMAVSRPMPELEPVKQQLLEIDAFTCWKQLYYR
jgi:hypothetical protein